MSDAKKPFVIDEADGWLEVTVNGLDGNSHDLRLDLLEAVDHLFQAAFRQACHGGPSGKAPHMG